MAPAATLSPRAPRTRALLHHRKGRIYGAFLVAVGLMVISFWAAVFYSSTPHQRFGSFDFGTTIYASRQPPLRLLWPSRVSHPTACDKLFGAASLRQDRQCLRHTVLSWAACSLPPIQVGVSAISSPQSSAEDSTVAPKWPPEWGMPLTEPLQRFLSAARPLPNDALHWGVDKETWNILVFQDWRNDDNKNAVQEKTLAALYQTYLVVRHWDVTASPFRIILMDRDTVAVKTLAVQAWSKVWGPDKVISWRSLVHQNTNKPGHVTLGQRSVVIQSTPSAIGEEALRWYKAGEEHCQGGLHYLWDFRKIVLTAYGIPEQHESPNFVNVPIPPPPTGTLPMDANATIHLTENRTLTLLYDLSPWSTEPKGKRPVGLVPRRAKEALREAYHVDELDRIYVGATGHLTLANQLSFISGTGVLILPQDAQSIVSIFLPTGATCLTFRRPSKRLGYILNSLGISYESQPMPTELQNDGLFGVPVTSRTIISNRSRTIDPKSLKTCDQLLGWDAIHRNGTCHTHIALSWTTCEIPALRFHPDLITGALGNESVHHVMGREEIDERLLFGNHSVESIGELNGNMTSSCQKVQEIQAFWKIVDPLSKTSSFQGVEVDKTPTLLVFRESYANPCWSIIVAYQTWLIAKLFDIGENFRILWMDGHAYTGLDDFWRDIFGNEVHHFQHFVNKSGITAFERPYVVHAGRLGLGNEALRMYRFGDACSPNSTLHEFREFVLQKYGYPAADTPKVANATKRLTFLIRRPYVAHPRAGVLMDRTIHDVHETEEELRRRYPDYDVKTVSFERKSFREQLDIIQKTDLLVSVHGAGNIHALFLPLTARFIEFYPPGYSSRKRFQMIASVLALHRKFVKGNVHRKIDGIVQLALAKQIKDLPVDF